MTPLFFMLNAFVREQPNYPVNAIHQPLLVGAFRPDGFKASSNGLRYQVLQLAHRQVYDSRVGIHTLKTILQQVSLILPTKSLHSAHRLALCSPCTS